MTFTDQLFIFTSTGALVFIFILICFFYRCCLWKNTVVRRAPLHDGAALSRVATCFMFFRIDCIVIFIFVVSVVDGLFYFCNFLIFVIYAIDILFYTDWWPSLHIYMIYINLFFISTLSVRETTIQCNIIGIMCLLDHRRKTYCFIRKILLHTFRIYSQIILRQHNHKKIKINI